MTPDVVAVRPLSHYQLEVEFANGEARHFNMTPYLSYPAYSRLREANLFMRAQVVNGTVCWTDEIDLSPDTLYLKGKPVRRLILENPCP